METGLVRYDAMVNAIVECHSIDEVKDIADKAKALEIYAKQARNTDAERKACDVRLRAERRCGELLRDLQRTPPSEASPNGRSGNQFQSAEVIPEKSPYAKALDSAGLNYQKANRMQALAEVPQAQFERALQAPEKPNMTKIIEANRPAPKPIIEQEPVKKISPLALKFWGTLRDIERDFPQISFDQITDTMTETMIADVSRLLPVSVDLFTRLMEQSNESA